MLVVCENCGLPHVSKTGSARKCLVCWKEFQGYELSKADNAHRNLAEETSKLLDKIESLKKENAERTLKIATLTVELNALKSQSPNTNGTLSSSIPEDTLKNLILLCHPDKHGNSTVATKVTQWLISLRKKK